MNSKMFGMLTLALGVLCSHAYPAEIGFQGPSLGYYLDQSTQELHSLMGLPGSATLSPVLATGFEVVWPGPDGRTALGLLQGTIFLLKDIHDTNARVPLMRWVGPVDNVVWSSDASGALIYSSDKDTFQTVTGLPANAKVNGEVNLRDLNGPLISLRLSTSPWTVAAIAGRRPPAALRSSSPVPAVPPPSLFIVRANGAPALVAGMTDPGAMDFSADGATLYIVDGASKQLMRLSVAGPAPAEPISLSSAELNPADFADVTVSSDGLRIFVLRREARQACALNSSSGDTVFCSGLDFSPARMTPVSGSLFLLDSTNSINDGTTPLWLLDGNSGQTFFVPRGGRLSR